MILHKDSHTDLIPKDIVMYVLDRFKRCRKPVIETIELPRHLGTVGCELYGPAMGDESVHWTNTWDVKRPRRDWESRLVNKPARQTNKLTVIAGRYDGHPCVLFTVYGGPGAPREPGDPSLKTVAEIEESKGFWAHHALSGVGL